MFYALRFGGLRFSFIITLYKTWKRESFTLTFLKPGARLILHACCLCVKECLIVCRMSELDHIGRECFYFTSALNNEKSEPKSTKNTCQHAHTHIHRYLVLWSVFWPPRTRFSHAFCQNIPLMTIKAVSVVHTLLNQPLANMIGIKILSGA